MQAVQTFVSKLWDEVITASAHLDVLFGVQWISSS